MTAFDDLLASPDAVRRWAMIADVWDAEAEATTPIYVSTDGFVTAPGDTPANVHFPPRLVGGPVVVETLYSGDRVGGAPLPDYGDVVINLGSLADDGSDRWDWLADYGWRGRRVRLYLGGEHADFAAFAAWGLVLDLVCDGIEAGTGQLRVRLRDRRHVLARPAQAQVFAGSGTYEGGVDLAGRLKPYWVSPAFNTQPVYVGKVGGLHVFCANGLAGDIPAAWSARSPLTRVETDSPGPGEYSVAVNASGTFLVMGGPDADTVATCNVEGPGTTAGPYETAADVAAWLALAAGMTEADFASGTVAALNAKNDAPLAGIGFDGAGQSPTFADLMSRALDSIGAVHLFTGGLLAFLRLEAPGTPAAAFANGIGADGPVERPASPRVGRVRVGYARNERPMSLAEVSAAAVDAGDAAFALQPIRWTEPAEDADVFAADPDAETFDKETHLAVAADAEAERDRLAALHGPERRTLELSVGAPAFSIDLGATITLTLDKLRLDAGADFVVIGRTVTLGADVPLVVWG